AQDINGKASSQLKALQITLPHSQIHLRALLMVANRRCEAKSSSINPVGYIFSMIEAIMLFRSASSSARG
ncbi:hypothetical protein, partial [Enorma massiliensis]|uniref:hypothetical protein n=1 Tax=Enorma massiliensis TaxID=1472761 RepID=UPI003AEF59A1